MNFARGDFGIEVIPGGRIIVAGGERGNGTQTELAMFDVEEYIVEVGQPIAFGALLLCFGGGRQSEFGLRQKRMHGFDADALAVAPTCLLPCRRTTYGCRRAPCPRRASGEPRCASTPLLRTLAHVLSCSSMLQLCLISNMTLTTASHVRSGRIGTSLLRA